MAKRTVGSFCGRWVSALCFVALGIAANGPAAQAGEVILKEQDINEQSITDALMPQDADESNVTRGIRFRDAVAEQHPASPARSASVHLLITFRTNSSRLTEGARAALDKVAHGLQSNKLSDFKFKIEGHADPRGSAITNQKLSEARASAVVQYLAHQGGIAADRLAPVGKGSTEPLNRHNPAAPENRRVTIVAVKS